MIAQLVAHRHLAAIITLITTLVACYGKGVDVSVVGIPADTQVTVSVDSLRQDIAAAPSKVYRYKGVGYARLLGLAAAPSYTATARRLDGCTVAVGSVEYNGEDEVRIDLHAVDGCGKPALDALYLTTHLHNMFGEKSAYISDIVERLVQSAGSPKALSASSSSSTRQDFWPGACYENHTPSFVQLLATTRPQLRHRDAKPSCRGSGQDTSINCRTSCGS